MEKHQLAHELRQRQYDNGILDRSVIAALSDDEIIDCYITCSDCGEKQVPSSALGYVIELALNVNHFLDICDSFLRVRTPPLLRRRKVRKTRARSC